MGAVEFLDAGLPLLVAVSPSQFDDAEMHLLTEGFERYFARGERYALLWTLAKGHRSPGWSERRRLGEWVSHPRVMDFTKRLCVCAAAVVPSAIERGALAGIMLFGKPAAPFRAVPNSAAGLDYCFEELGKAGLTLPRPADLIRFETLRALGE